MFNTPENPSQPGPHKRRSRYRGTHPRQFDERYKELHPEKYPEMQEHIRAAGRTPAGTHVPILVNEVMQSLAPAPGEVVADCTLGYGGHALEFMRRIGPKGRLVGFDVDAESLERVRVRLEEVGVPFSLHRSNFAGIAKALPQEALQGYDVIFADLGVSSMQVDDPHRGFSYKQDGPLDMRMDDRIARSAADLLRELPAEEIAAALEELADEPDSERIAGRIVKARAKAPIASTLQLVDLILDVKGISHQAWRRMAQRGETHPAARTFQALRILVNDELSSLKHLLRIAPHCLRAGGRLGIISFHSGEDRLVKKAFEEGLQSGAYASISEDVIRPTPQEIHSNPRSSSAKFRWAKTAGGVK